MRAALLRLRAAGGGDDPVADPVAEPALGGGKQPPGGVSSHLSAVLRALDILAAVVGASEGEDAVRAA